MGGNSFLLKRPHWNYKKGEFNNGTHRIETVNDIDGYVSNFWRSVSFDPEKTAYYANLPVNQVDLQVRHQWLIDQEPILQQLKDNPDYYDCKIAGYWVWGINLWIGTGWCQKSFQQIPHLGDAGTGIHRPNTKKIDLMKLFGLVPIA